MGHPETLSPAHFCDSLLLIVPSQAHGFIQLQKLFANSENLHLKSGCCDCDVRVYYETAREKMTFVLHSEQYWSPWQMKERME